MLPTHTQCSPGRRLSCAEWSARSVFALHRGTSRTVCLTGLQSLCILWLLRLLIWQSHKENHCCYKVITSWTAVPHGPRFWKSSGGSRLFWNLIRGKRRTCSPRFRRTSADAKARQLVFSNTDCAPPWKGHWPFEQALMKMRAFYHSLLWAIEPSQKKKKKKKKMFPLLQLTKPPDLGIAQKKKKVGLPWQPADVAHDCESLTKRGRVSCMRLSVRWGSSCRVCVVRVCLLHWSPRLCAGNKRKKNFKLSAWFLSVDPDCTTF